MRFFLFTVLLFFSQISSADYTAVRHFDITHAGFGNGEFIHDPVPDHLLVCNAFLDWLHLNLTNQPTITFDASTTITSCRYIRQGFAGVQSQPITSLKDCSDGLGFRGWDSAPGGTGGNCLGDPPPEPEPCEAGRVLDSLSVSNFNSVEPTNLRCISGCYAPVKVSLQSQICYPAGTNYPAGCVIPAYFEWIDNGQECEGGSDPWASTSPDPLPPQPTEPPNCPECDCIKSGQGYGTVNGAVVCVGLGSEGSKPVEFKGAPIVTTTTPAPTPENPNPEPVTTVTSSTSSTTVGASTGSGSSGAGTDNPQVTTTTTDENGNTIETTQDKESFCSSNPTHALCQPKTDCDKYPDSIACQIMGDAPELGEGDGIPTIEREISQIVKPSLPEAAGCPAPINISIGGHSITVSFQPFCDYAEAFRPLVIASAWLSAALIVVGFRGNE